MQDEFFCNLPLLKRQKLLFKTIEKTGDLENSQALSFSFGTSGELHIRYKENQSLQNFNHP